MILEKISSYMPDDFNEEIICFEFEYDLIIKERRELLKIELIYYLKENKFEIEIKTDIKDYARIIDDFELKLNDLLIENIKKEKEILNLIKNIKKLSDIDIEKIKKFEYTENEENIKLSFELDLIVIYINLNNKRITSYDIGYKKHIIKNLNLVNKYKEEMLRFLSKESILRIKLKMS